MAISYIVGIPRSGKSYLAVYHLWQNFIYKPKENKFLKFLKKDLKQKKDYISCYTNINEFNFSASNKIFPLDFISLHSNLKYLYDMYKNGSEDYELIEQSKEFNIYKTLFILDECHNFLTDKEDKVITWWLTYHGHLYQDIYLITQNLDLVSKEYKKIAEFFYMAVEPSKRLNTKKFRYVQFTSYKMFQKDVVRGGGYNLPQVQEVFDLYKSGDENLSKSVVQKYIKISFLLIFILFVSLYFFFKQFDTKHEEPKITLKSNITNIVAYENFLYKTYSFYCIRDVCNYKGFHFPFYLYTKFKNDINYKIFETFRSYYSYVDVYIVFPNENIFTKFLDKGALENASNDKDNSLLSISN